ncbi:hypothetical protein DFJ74DRAFT_685532 [Hyaloraphidium curvatum]|nr:hypothetical protein DFJ74DRAFT_685532 [Hyaloraphidium curvatum]
MSSDPFDPELALWSIRIYRGEGGHRNAVVFGISHIVGDGISLMKLATSFFAEAGTGKQLKFTPPPRWNPTFKSWAERIGFFLADAWYMVRAFTRVAGFLFGADTKTEIKCGYYPDYKYVPTRRCVQFRPIPFDVLNKVRELAQGKLGSTRKPTIHDVLHSLFAGAIAAYLEERKDEGFRKAGKGALVRIWTPFMFPHPDFSQDPSDDLHNMWSMSSTALPVTEPDPLRRLANSQRVNSNLLRSGHDARAVMMTQRWFSTLFGWEIQGIINLRATTAHTLTWSNVPGFSRTPIAVYAPNGGPLRTVDDAVFVLSAPTPYVTSHSYAGRLNTVMIADPGLVKDMERFGELFYEGFRELAGCVGVEVE